MAGDSLISTVNKY